MTVSVLDEVLTANDTYAIDFDKGELAMPPSRPSLHSARHPSIGRLRMRCCTRNIRCQTTKPSRWACTSAPVARFEISRWSLPFVREVSRRRSALEPTRTPPA